MRTTGSMPAHGAHVVHPSFFSRRMARRRYMRACNLVRNCEYREYHDVLRDFLAHCHRVQSAGHDLRLALTPRTALIA